MYKYVKKEQPLTITPEEIDKIENQFGIVFPKMLREYYLSFNGVKINVCVFRVNGNEYEVAKIIPLKTEGNSFESIKHDELEEEFIPKEFMPLARDRGGDYYYWDSKDESVYLVYPDCIERPVYICHSVEAFFDLLENAEIE